MLPDASCDTPPEPDSCTALFDMGDAILEVVLAALEPFNDPAVCGDSELRGYVGLADPTIPFEDYFGGLVVVYLRQFGPTSKSQSDAARAANPQMVPLVMEASWQVEIREGPYPGLTNNGDEPVFPRIVEYHEANRHLHAHGYAAYRGLIGAYRAGTLFDDVTQCPVLRFGTLLPIAPQAYMAGWTWDVTGEVPQ